MRELKLEGHYTYNVLPGGRGDLTGKIIVAPNGMFEGQVMDYHSRAPHQQIRGFLFEDNGLVELSFLKFPPHAALANLVYCLTKNESDGLTGLYKGDWRALPFKIGFSSGDHGVFMASFDMSELEFGDRAEIRLYD